MLNKKTSLLLWGNMILFYGCVNSTYDLNKEINMDVTIPGNKITLPVGNVKPIVLDSLIDVDDIDMLEKMDGVYSLHKSDEIDPIDIDIDPIKINIDPITHSSTFQFDEATIESVVLDGLEEEQTFGVNQVSIDDLNSSLPTLESKVVKELYNSDIEDQINSLKGSGILQEITLPLKNEVSTEKQEVSFALNYELPSEIKEISEITLNNLVEFEIDNPEILDNAKKTVTFTATFPEGFILAIDNSAPNADKYLLSNNARTISANGLASQGGALIVQFFIKKLVGLKEHHHNGSIILDEAIEYQVDYEVDGDVIISANTSLDDFNFVVSMNHKVTFDDAKGITNDIDVDFETLTLDFSAHFEDLEHIKKVEYIEFDATKSKIYFTTDLGDGGFEPFNLKEGCQLKLSFPEKFVLAKELCVYPKGVTFKEEEHAFYISDINALHNKEWQIALDRINVDADVHDNKIDLPAEATISSVSGVLKLGETNLESLNTTLERLKTKNVNFKMEKTCLYIDDAVVLTDVINEEIEEEASFSVNEKIDDGVSRIESIDFYNEVPINLNVKMSGVEEIKTNVHLKLDITLPSFLKISSKDERVKCENGKMCIDTDYQPEVGELNIELFAERIHFTGNGMDLEEIDGSYYLIYESKIPIVGEASINETEMHSTILEKDIEINVNFTIGEIEVKKFSGIYCGEIDDIHETIDFDLGEDLDFLKEDNNTITLSDPQIKFSIDNPVGIPVDIALSLFGKDDNGQIIETSRIEKSISIDPADYNYATGDLTTRKMNFLLTNKDTQLDGYTNVVIQDLSNLLKKIPNSLEIELKPTINQSVTHHVDLSKELVFHPEYDVVVPLKFDNIHIEYTEVIEDLNEDLGETLEYFSNIVLKATMNIRNTVPVGLTLNIEPLDVNGAVIEDIEVDAIQIAAGNGKKINETDGENTGEEVVLVVKSKGDVLCKLDKLNLFIEGDANETVGGEAITPEQGVQITNIVLEVTGDIETNLDEL